MKLTSVIIKNYKSINYIHLKDMYNSNNGLNILLGVNEVGKTCILEAINLLNPISNNPNTNKSHNYQIECHKPSQNKNEEIEITGEFELSKEKLIVG